MAASHRRTTPALTSVRDRLFAEPYTFEFFQAVRLLTLLSPECPLVGAAASPEHDLVRFRARTDLSFPASTLHAFEPISEEWPIPRLTVNFFGLTGRSGVLPTHYTQLLLDLERDERGPERYALRDWLDLFNHRLLSLFYGAWEKYRFTIGYEHGQELEQQAFTLTVLSLFGLGTRRLRQRLQVRSSLPVTPAYIEAPLDPPLARIDDLALLFHAGLLAQRPANPTNLRILLENQFGVPVCVEPFHGRWQELDRSLQTALGGQAQLGVNAIAGSHVWDVQGQFRLRIGPLNYEQFLELLPDHSPNCERKTFFLLTHLSVLFVGVHLAFDVQLVLAAHAVPEAQLTDAGVGPRLGWNLWLITASPAQDADDPVFPGNVVTVLH